MKHKLNILGALTAGIFATGLAVTATEVSAKDIVINMAGPDWGPTRFLQEKFNKTYKAKSGNNVKLVFDFIPWPNFYDRVAASLTSGEKKYQMVVSDSQWIGTFIEGGHFLKLNKYIDADPTLQAIMKDTHPAFVEAYATYPHKSKNYYGFPQFPDTKMTWFRKDLFCHAGEKAAFKAKFGGTLPCTYAEWKDTDWKTWASIGEFFRRNKGDKLGDGVAADDFYGIAYQAGKGLDFSSMQINAFIWQHGGSIWDEANEPKAQAVGVVNNAASVKGFQHYLDLLKWSPPVAKTGQMDIFVIQELIMQGKVAAIINWAGLAPPALDPKNSKHAKQIDFALTPGLRGKDGKISRWDNIGGQPFVLTTWNSDEVTMEALEIVKWWMSPEVQLDFAKNGGESGLMSVMARSDYNSIRPWNRAHVELLDWQKDVWHVPEFFEMLTQQQEEFDKAITGQKTAKQALDAIAKFQQDLLTEAGRIQ
ncbi:MAG: extracellular solute-binding protein [Rhodospirillaceae bacterium]|jgi:multiple sugar transport system substrate-binding protein|nr:extracellular solute-binding protein [Rhodospirillaceae bacterium]MBT4488014.1 extracellular solute-binding protein [Rhodospirillaceae bacterium]MBT5192632.1 extracellular solute-binding protein [Rhodospirillaceae bacterium]MBT5895625.1 extracellular solute-binding protein [Rhodospirillaceae bacterium]MBT6428281.1 extracellular solute-binding protein [Rhodospirillaceae bacterium]